MSQKMCAMTEASSSSSSSSKQQSSKQNLSKKIVTGRIEIFNVGAMDGNDSKKRILKNWEFEAVNVHQYISSMTYVVITIITMIFLVFLFIATQDNNGLLLVSLITLAAIVVAGFVLTNFKIIDLIKYRIDKVHDVILSQQENESFNRVAKHKLL